MQTAEYQALYDEAFDITWMDCETFDVYFRMYDNSYMSAMKKIRNRELVHKGKDPAMTQEQFDVFW